MTGQHAGGAGARLHAPRSSHWGRGQGSSGTLATDTATTVPVIVLGDVPSVGDYRRLMRSAAGGYRSGAEVVDHHTTRVLRADIPEEDLTITWTNAFTGLSSRDDALCRRPGPDLDDGLASTTAWSLA